MQDKVYAEGTHMCRTCGETKPISAFHLINRMSGPRPRFRCRSCDAAASMTRYRMNREAINAARNIRRKTNPDRVSLERAKERASDPFAKTRRGNKIKALRFGVAHEEIDYAALLVRDNLTCYLCEIPVTMETLTFDHVIPMSRGGGNIASNLRVAHRACNSRKGSLIPGEERPKKTVACPNCGHRVPVK